MDKKECLISLSFEPDDSNYFHDAYTKNKLIDIDFDWDIHKQLKKFILEAGESIDFINYKKGSNMYIWDGELVWFIYRYTTEYDRGNYNGYVKKHGNCWVNLNIPNCNTAELLKTFSYEF